MYGRSWKSGRLVGLGFATGNGVAWMERLEARVLFAAVHVDPTFGQSGGPVNDPRFTGFNQIVMEGDGSTLAVGADAAGGTGESASDGNTGFLVAKYNADGTPDTSWGNDGLVRVTLATAGRYVAWRVAIAGDGKITVGGGMHKWMDDFDPAETIAFVRLNTDGTLDTSFGQQGVVTTPGENLFDMKLQSDGKLVELQSFPYIGERAFVRFNVDGSVDRSFGTGGDISPYSSHRVTAFESGGAVSPRGAVGETFALTADDKIVMGTGCTFANGSGIVEQGLSLLRLNTDGSPDLSLDNGGVNSDPTGMLFLQPGNVVIPLGSQSGGVQQISVGADGKMLFALDNYQVVRLSENGSLDVTFGDSGIAASTTMTAAYRPLGAVESSVGMTVAADGSIIQFSRTNGPFHAVRYSPDGQVDATFGDNGIFSASFGDSTGIEGPGGELMDWDEPAGVVIQADGEILVAGRSQDGGQINGLLARLTEKALPPAPVAPATPMIPPTTPAVVEPTPAEPTADGGDADTGTTGGGTKVVPNDVGWSAAARIAAASGGRGFSNIPVRTDSSDGQTGHDWLFEVF